MARRDFRRGAAAISKKRLTSWGFLAPVESTLAAGGGSVIIGSLNAASLAARPFTGTAAKNAFSRGNHLRR